MNPSHAAALACCAALAGCVGVPADELLASTGIVAELSLESGARVEAARFSAGRAGESQPGWGRFIVSPFATNSEYALVESGPGVVLEGRADGSASGFYRRIRIDPKRHPVMEWRWRVLQTPADLDPRVNARDDSPARVIVAFHGDAARLDIGERFTLALYKALTGERMPRSSCTAGRATPRSAPSARVFPPARSRRSSSKAAAASASGASSGATCARTTGSPSARNPGTSSRWG